MNKKIKRAVAQVYREHYEMFRRGLFEFQSKQKWVDERVKEFELNYPDIIKEDNPVSPLDNKELKLIIECVISMGCYKKESDIKNNRFIKILKKLRKLQSDQETDSEQPKYDLIKWFRDQSDQDLSNLNSKSIDIYMNGISITLLNTGKYILNDTTG